MSALLLGQKSGLCKFFVRTIDQNQLVLNVSFFNRVHFCRAQWAAGVVINGEWVGNIHGIFFL
jgi:hypothetical protein